jgi:hypothetical protein
LGGDWVDLLVGAFVISKGLLMINVVAHVVLWFSRNKRVLLRIGSLLVVRRAGNISLALESLVLGLFGSSSGSLLSESLLVRVIQSLRLSNTDSGCIGFSHLHLLR